MPEIVFKNGTRITVNQHADKTSLKTACAPDRRQCGPYVSVSLFDEPHVSVGGPFNPNAAQLIKIARGCFKAAKILRRVSAKKIVEK